MSKSTFIGVLVVLFLTMSCKKKTEVVVPPPTSPDTTTISTSYSKLYGFTVPANVMYDSIATCSFGEINPFKATISNLGRFTNTVIANKAAFNTTDNCYYAFFSTTYWAGTMACASPLYKIAANGSITALLNSDSKARYSWLTYNKANNKFYCLKKTTLNNSIVEVTIASNTFFTTAVASPLYPFARSFTVDNATGDLYYVSIDTPSSISHIERFRPGTTNPESIAFSQEDLYQSSLCFNSNDKMLYATTKTWDPGGAIGFNFIQINPSTGAFKTLAHHNIALNPFFTSVCIDPISNRYIFSTVLTDWGAFPASCILGQLNMKGVLMKNNTTTSFFQGLIAK